jgi:acetylornithine/N-succinyldiaminopimelate aminotransferase
MQPGNHGSTFGGNPLACAGALATVETIENQQLSLKAAKIGDRLLAGFKERLAGVKTVKDVRGRGLMIGIQMTMPCKSLFAQALDAGLVINVTADSVIRLLPPLIFDEAHADQLMDVLVPLIVNFKGD